MPNFTRAFLSATFYKMLGEFDGVLDGNLPKIEALDKKSNNGRTKRQEDVLRKAREERLKYLKTHPPPTDNPEAYIEESKQYMEQLLKQIRGCGMSNKKQHKLDGPQVKLQFEQPNDLFSFKQSQLKESLFS